MAEKPRGRRPTRATQLRVALERAEWALARIGGNWASVPLHVRVRALQEANRAEAVLLPANGGGNTP